MGRLTLCVSVPPGPIMKRKERERNKRQGDGQENTGHEDEGRRLYRVAHHRSIRKQNNVGQANDFSLGGRDGR